MIAFSGGAGGAGDGVYGENVLPYLRRSVEGVAVHATSRELRGACRRRRRWPPEVRASEFMFDEMTRHFHERFSCHHRFLFFFSCAGDNGGVCAFIRFGGFRPRALQFNGFRGLSLTPDETRLLCVT